MVYEREDHHTGKMYDPFTSLQYPERVLIYAKIDFVEHIVPVRQKRSCVVDVDANDSVASLEGQENDLFSDRSIAASDCEFHSECRCETIRG